MRRFLMALATVALAGCNFLIDPDAPPRPPDAPPPPLVTCTPVGCASVTCGYVDCGTVCAQGSGCLVTHRVTGGFSSGADQPELPAAGHYVGGGIVTGSTAAAAAADGGHGVTGATVH
jgi:hypothetical protein